jgi:hypothetical protein
MKGKFAPNPPRLVSRYHDSRTPLRASRKPMRNPVSRPSERWIGRSRCRQVGGGGRMAGEPDAITAHASRRRAY